MSGPIGSSRSSASSTGFENLIHDPPVLFRFRPVPHGPLAFLGLRHGRPEYPNPVGDADGNFRGDSRGLLHRPALLQGGLQVLGLHSQARRVGSDNGYEYKFFGTFSGETVYEPASNGFYPEFVLKGYELRNVSPAPIFKVIGALDPQRRIIAKPY
jgi:hypothetical protein